jgi:hypothetical protein
MFAYQGNLCQSDDENPSAFSGPEFHNFDIAAVGLGFHVSNPPPPFLGPFVPVKMSEGKCIITITPPPFPPNTRPAFSRTKERKHAIRHY